jgi:hypothetical protein
MTKAEWSLAAKIMRMLYRRAGYDYPLRLIYFAEKDGAVKPEEEVFTYPKTRRTTRRSSTSLGRGLSVYNPPFFPLSFNPKALIRWAHPRAKPPKNVEKKTETCQMQCGGENRVSHHVAARPPLPGKRSGVLTRPTVDEPVAVITALWRSPASM